MWPYNDDEAGWLTPPLGAVRLRPASANDNDPNRRVPPRGRPAPQPTRKTKGET
jgi:hypothetical protein